MPGLGLVPARGEWTQRWFEVLSTATFQKGSLVNFNSSYQVREYLSTDSQVVGIAVSASTGSQTLGGVKKVAVYVPAPNCTAYSDLTTGVTQAALPIGKRTLVYKQGNLMSYASTVMGHASNFSSIAAVVGPIDADLSRVEIAFNMDNVAFYSTSSTTFAS
ncbi:MAG TPA: hypothetical protein VJS20_12645 [Gemmatimonadales bacterium]|nr:hypothetical protein [Gemmatimonadales bacterium]